MASQRTRSGSLKAKLSRALIFSFAIVFGLSGCGSTIETEKFVDSGNNPKLDSTTIELKIEAFSDFYFTIRAQAAGVQQPNDLSIPIIDAWKPVQDLKGSFRVFWRFDLAGLTATSPAGFDRWFDHQPPVVTVRRVGPVPIQGPGKAMASAMGPAWITYLQDDWPDRKLELENVIAQLNETFIPRHQQALVFMMDSLGIVDPKIEIATYLVTNAHPPGATTFRLGSKPIAVLSISQLLAEGQFSVLEETLLHETCHALDLASAGTSSAFSELRLRLQRKGVTDQKTIRDIPHLIMFVQSEETMRRIFNEHHRAYGDTWRGEIPPLYERSGVAAGIVRKHWGDYLDQRITRSVALDLIASEVAEHADMTPPQFSN